MAKGKIKFHQGGINLLIGEWENTGILFWDERGNLKQEYQQEFARPPFDSIAGETESLKEAIGQLQIFSEQWQRYNQRVHQEGNRFEGDDPQTMVARYESLLEGELKKISRQADSFKRFQRELDAYLADGGYKDIASPFIGELRKICRFAETADMTFSVMEDVEKQKKLKPYMDSCQRYYANYRAGIEKLMKSDDQKYDYHKDRIKIEEYNRDIAKTEDQLSQLSSDEYQQKTNEKREKIEKSIEEKKQRLNALEEANQRLLERYNTLEGLKEIVLQNQLEKSSMDQEIGKLNKEMYKELDNLYDVQMVLENMAEASKKAANKKESIENAKNSKVLKTIELGKLREKCKEIRPLLKEFLADKEAPKAMERLVRKDYKASEYVVSSECFLKFSKLQELLLELDKKHFKLMKNREHSRSVDQLKEAWISYEKKLEEDYEKNINKLSVEEQGEVSEYFWAMNTLKLVSSHLKRAEEENNEGKRKEQSIKDAARMYDVNYQNSFIAMARKAYALICELTQEEVNQYSEEELLKNLKEKQLTTPDRILAEVEAQMKDIRDKALSDVGEENIRLEIGIKQEEAELKRVSWENVLSRIEEVKKRREEKIERKNFYVKRQEQLTEIHRNYTGYYQESRKLYQEGRDFVMGDGTIDKIVEKARYFSEHSSDAMKEGHQNSREYEAIKGSLERFNNYEGSKNLETVQRLIEELRAAAEAYIEAKDAQWFHFMPSTQRIVRYNYARSILQFCTQSEVELRFANAQQDMAIRNVIVAERENEGKYRTEGHPGDMEYDDFINNLEAKAEERNHKNGNAVQQQRNQIFPNLMNGQRNPQVMQEAVPAYAKQAEKQLLPN